MLIVGSYNYSLYNILSTLYTDYQFSEGVAEK